MEKYTGLSNKPIRIFKCRTTSYNEFAGRLLGLYVSLSALNSIVTLFFEGAIIDSIRPLLFMGVFWGYILFNPNYMVKFIKQVIIWYVVWIMVMIIGIIGGNSTLGEIVTRFYYLFFFGLPLFGIFRDVTDPEAVISNSKGCIRVTSLCALFTIVQGALAGGIKGDYSQTLGYALLFPTMIIMHLFFTSKKGLYVLLWGLNVFTIVSYGSRGQVLCIFIFTLLYFLARGQKLTVKKCLLFFTFILASVVIALFFKEILSYMIDVLGKLGIHSRSLGYFLERTTYTGREVVWADAIERINEKPLLGWTVGVATSEKGFFPHNIFLELWLHYGYVVGGVLSFLLVCLVIKAIFLDRRDNTLKLAMFCYGFVPLMLSSEYLVWPTFWAFLGLCLMRKQRKTFEQYTLECE